LSPAEAGVQLVQPVSLLIWLSDSIPPSPSLALGLWWTVQVWVVRPAFAALRLLRRGRHPLILDGLCLHVLSSFQRTGPSRQPGTSPEVLSGVCLPASKPSKGEPYEFTLSVNRLSTQNSPSSPVWIDVKDRPKLPNVPFRQGPEARWVSRPVPLRTF
jgi:hypothetical protein